MCSTALLNLQTGTCSKHTTVCVYTAEFRVLHQAMMPPWGETVQLLKWLTCQEGKNEGFQKDWSAEARKHPLPLGARLLL